MKKYKFSFDPWGLGLFLLIMIPSFIWFAVPAPVDIMRAESRTPGLDVVMQVFQILLVGALCCVKNREAPLFP